MIRNILLITIITIIAVTISYSFISQCDDSTSLILSADEIRTLADNIDDTFYMRFSRSMGNIEKNRDISINASGEWVMHDRQHSIYVKDMLDNGDLDRDFFSDIEYDYLTAEIIDYDYYYKGVIDIDIIKSILRETADVIEDNYQTSMITGEYYWSDSIELYFGIKEGSYNGGIVIIEEVNEDYHDIDKLNLLYMVETIIDEVLKDENVEESDCKEYIEFKEEYGLKMNKVFYEQWNLR